MESTKAANLPLEVIQLIIQSSVPRPTFGSFAERKSTLLPLLRVNKTWSTIARRELYRHIGIGNPTEAIQFAANLVVNPHLGLLTTSVHFGEVGVELQGYQRAMAMLAILPRVPKVKKIWISGLRPISLFGLALAPELESLYANNVRFMEPLPFPPHPVPALSDSPVLLRHLRHLSLHSSALGLVDVFDESTDVSSVPVSEAFPVLFPQLESVSIIDSRTVARDLALHAMDLSPVASECTTLTIDNRPEGAETTPAYISTFSLDWEQLLPSYSAATKLSVTDTASLGTLLDTFQPSVLLQTLRLAPFELTMNQITESYVHFASILTEVHSATRKLAKLVVPRVVSEEALEPVDMVVEDENRENVAQSMEQKNLKRLREVCEARGVVLEEREVRKDAKSGTYSENWEDIDWDW